MDWYIYLLLGNLRIYKMTMNDKGLRYGNRWI